MEDAGMKNKDEVKKSKKVEALLWKDIKIACEKHDELQLKSFNTDTGCEALAYELKVKLISKIYDDQEEACLEIEDIEEELNE